MKRYRVHISVWLRVTVCLLAPILFVSAEERPNVVLIVVDDLGWNDVGYHNPEMHTPNIDKLVRENVELNRFYVTPQCSPTRAGLMTGRYPHRFGLLDGVVSPSKAHGLPPAEYSLAEMLGDAGYKHRGMLGKWHLGLRSKIFHPLNHGFTEFYGHYNGAIDYLRRVRAGELDWHRNYESCIEEGYATELLTREAVKFVEAKSAEDAPYFLYLAYNAPHSPLQALEEDLLAEGFDESSGRMPTDDGPIAKREGDPDYGRAGTGNNERQTYRAVVRALDRGIGQVIQAIDDSSELENTLVIFTGDNGGTPAHGGNNEPLRGTKFQTYEGGVRVPAAVRWPAKFDSPRVIKDTLAYIDVWPTLAEIAGVDNDAAEIDGEDMMPFLTSSSVNWTRTLYLRGGSIIDGEWKLVADTKECDDPRECGKLFNIKNDPYEKMDLADSMPNKVHELYALTERFRALAGPSYESGYESVIWPPKNWKLSDEPSEN